MFLSCLCTITTFFFPATPIYVPGEGRAARPGRRAGTTSKKMGTGPERWAMRGEVGGKRVWGMSVVLGWSQREGTLRTWPHFLAPPPTLSLLIFASFLFRVPVEREGNQVPQGSRALRYGEDGWPGTPCKPSGSGSPSPSQYIPVEFALQPESNSFYPRVMWARMEPLGSLEKR